MRHLKFHQLLSLFFLTTFLFAQNLDVAKRNNADEYFDYISVTNRNHLIKLNGTWQYKRSDALNWESISIPSSYLNEDRITFKRTFSLEKQFKKNQIILHVKGIHNFAVFELNGETIYTYNYNGAEVEIPLDKNLLYFEQENTLEITVDNILNYQNSFPRKYINSQALMYGGITKDIYIEVIPDLFIGNLDYQRKNQQISFEIQSIGLDSLKKLRLEEISIFTDLDDKEIVRIPRTIIGNQLETRKINLDHSANQQIKNLANSAYKIKVFIQLFENKNQLAVFENSVTSFPDFDAEPLRIIAKVEQYPNKMNQADFRDIEIAIEKIRSTGFNAIYFPYDNPHPYFVDLAKRNKLQVFVALPFFSFTEVQLKMPETDIYIKNYIAQTVRNYQLVLHTLYPNETARQLAEKYKLTLLSNNQLVYNGKTIHVIDPVAGQYKSTAGYQTQFSEDYQSKLLTEQIEPEQSFLLFYYSDFYSPMPHIRNKRIGDLLMNQTGLLSFDRSEKKAYKDIKSKLSSDKELAFNPGENIPQEEYSFIILGIISLAIFVIAFRQTVRLSNNLKRAFLHAHGFFSDTRDRRILYMGQTSFLVFILILINGNIFASLIYFHRNNELMNILINYFFSADTSYYLLQTIDTPYSLQILCVILTFALIIVMTACIKFLSFFIGRKVNLKQCATVTTWSAIPLLFLLPLSVGLYNMLAFNLYVTYANYAIIILLAWSLLRWINGARVIIDVSHTSVILLSLLCLAVLLGSLWGSFEYFKNISDYVDYFDYLTNK
ncbi:MAG: YIP1 family protein [Calditrichaeota bacterium]|nr:YIP1 family protein [Calditrichota bacterium]